MTENNDDELKDFMNELAEAEKKSSSGTSGGLTPAWGGARKQGSVPVPLAFDSVTSLGPATAVHGRNDIQLFSSLAASKTLVLYRDGFAYQSGSEKPQIWRWNEITTILSNVELPTRVTHHSYNVIKKSGESLVLDETLKDVTDLIDPIKHNVFALLLPPLTSQYTSGQTISFGTVTIQHQNGIQISGKTYFRWDDIMDIKVERGRFKITMRDNKQYEVRSSSIPNIEMLCKLIGLKINPADLIYF
jgi:hypothetical protein